MAADILGNSSVYLLTVPNGKGYVGYSDGPLDERWKNGDGYKGHPEFFADIEKYGWENIGKRAVMRGMSKQVVRNCEPFFIKWFNTQWPHGYNKDSGGTSGYHRCQYTKDKIRAALSLPIAQIDRETGEIINVWPSIKAAATALKISAGDISLAANGHRKSAGGYDWHFVSKHEAAGENPAAVLLPEGGEQA